MAAKLTSVLARDLGLPEGTEAIVFGGGLPRDPRFPGQTGKLQPVAAWLESARERMAVDAVVWIDDNLREDAYAWAREQDTPFHLIRPDAATGLTSDEVGGAEEFLAAGRTSRGDIRE
ncbi:HAD domain-containing protein [Rathayibacter oskolensis]|uniref:HAD domain-containing protein n=1 Tax=Rathayibacter oskolensis TaxID=1891671 RepID=UPI00265D8A6E|nr:HAD domain-containing protein [Rathayibacter oskolensis]WKK72048.1 HAD domain-containing protein [Rathayibacter oskolensis]